MEGIGIFCAKTFKTISSILPSTQQEGKNNTKCITIIFRFTHKYIYNIYEYI